MSTETLEFTEQIRRKVLNTVGFFFLFIITVLAIFNVVYHSQYLFASLELLFSFFSLYVFIKSRHNACPPKITFLYLLCIAMLIVLGSYLLPISDVLFLWGFFFPTIAYLLLGKSLGFQLSLVVFVLLSAVITHGVLASDLFDVQPVMINFITCYLTIWCVSHFFELSRAKTQESLIKLAFTDALTSTNNRLAFSKTFDNYLDDYLLMIDIDNFKSINDQYGHDVGDRALTLISDSFKSEADCSRTFRVGGEEFCVWLSASDIERALTHANKLRTAIADIRLYADDERVHLSFSGGLVKHDANLNEPALLKSADKLLYQAKNQGKDRIEHCLKAL
jgi:diguanylate cyclase